MAKSNLFHAFFRLFVCVWTFWTDSFDFNSIFRFISENSLETFWTIYFTGLFYSSGSSERGGVIVRQTSICVHVSLGQISVFSIICQSRFDLVPVYGYIDYDSRGACFKLKLVPR